MLHKPYTRRRLAAELAAAVAVGHVLTSTASCNPAPTVAAKPVRWMFHRGPGLAAVAADPRASRVLDGTQPYILKKGGDRFVIPPTWNAIPVTPFQAFGELQAAIQQRTLAADIKGVLYDYEKWQFTPIEEQRNPLPYVKQASELVRGEGLRFLTSPSANLVKVMAPETGPSDPEIFESYLRLGIAAHGARYADAYVAQGQRALQSTEVFAYFIQQAAAQARRANPNVEVIGNLSTNPLGRRATVDDLIRAIDATREFVDGYWMNIPTRNAYSPDVNEYRPDIAIEVIRRVAGQ
jgi:hypothetical protein